MAVPQLSSPIIDLSVGSEVRVADRSFTILGYASAGVLNCRDTATRQRVMLKIGNLADVRDASPIRLGADVAGALEDVSEDDWMRAESRLASLTPLLDRAYRRGDQAYKTAATAHGVSVATIYQWLAKYRRSGKLLSSLIPYKPSGGKGGGRLSEDVEAIIAEYIRSEYLTMQKPSIKTTVDDIRTKCINSKLPPPAANTIRLRIGWIDEKRRIERRKGRAAVHAQFAHSRGSIPNANWPLQLVQIDHTLLPVIIVDSVHRKSIRRAWITVAIDVFSRVILGLYVSLDPPSTESVGECLSHALLLKDDWLKRINAGDEWDWPFWGTPEVLLADNAKEFRGSFLRKVCKEYDCDLQWRPVKKPHWGAHIERLIGSISQWLKDLPGTTFSGVIEKWDYDSEGNAKLTLDELVEWLVVRAHRYHFVDIHRGIEMTPSDKWMEGVTGQKTGVPRGYPFVRTNVDKVRFDFMPAYPRTVQHNGVSITDILYWDDVLRPWIGVKDPATDQAIVHNFRRARYNVSVIYFWDPKRKEIFEIGSQHQRMSLWEWEASKADLGRQGKTTSDPIEVAKHVNKTRGIEAKASESTKSARRTEERRRQHERQSGNSIVASNSKTRKVQSVALVDYDPDQITPLPEE